jgi:hypothetical protein
MSAKVTAWVWHESQAKGTDFLVLLAHADESNDNGRCSASVRNLARKARVDDRTVQRARERLVALGELAEVGHDTGPRGTAVYRVLMPSVPRVVSPTGGESPPGGESPGVAERQGWQPATGQTATQPDMLGGGESPGVASRRTSSTTTSSKSPSEVVKSGAAKRGTRLPDDWLRSDSDKAWQAEQGIPDELAREWTAAFKDHFRAATGANSTKRDWSAAWRNWMRREWRDEQRRGRGSRGTVEVHDFAAIREQQRAEAAARQESANSWMRRGPGTRVSS